MYHYLGNFQLYKTAKCDVRSGLRYLCKIDNAHFACQVTIVDRERISPSESAEVELTFLSIDLVSSLVQLGNHYQLCEGSCSIGEIWITKDPWYEIEKWVSEGEIRKAVVVSVGWTAAEVSLEGGIKTLLMSEDMGLQEWEEINQVLKAEEIIKVRIEKIDKIYRKMKISLIDGVS